MINTLFIDALFIDALLGHANTVALAIDNGNSWLAADLACSRLQKVCVPLPHFFSPSQIEWVLDSAGVDAVLTDQPDLPLWQALGLKASGAAGDLVCLTRAAKTVVLPPGTAKITFTSGSTGQPKGVCLSQLSQQSVAHSIAAHMRRCGVQRHLCALPLSVLLENVAGAHAAILADAECIAPPLAEIGWQGSSEWNASAFLQCVAERRIESAILLPQMLKAVLPLLHRFDVSSLKLVAIGGARVAPELLLQAREKGLPVYEGYGLSECGSVVCLNYAGADKPGTVGQALPHVAVRLSAEGELEVAAANYLGYLGQLEYSGQDATQQIPAWLPTGDLASIDAEGFVTIHGRKKNLIISSFGRNISPEWVEGELLAQKNIVQAAVFGEARPNLVAVLFAPELSDDELQHAVKQANKNLPDYAQCRQALRATEAFTRTNNLATANGRNRRDNIAAHYKIFIDALYEQDEKNQKHEEKIA